MGKEGDMNVSLVLWWIVSYMVIPVIKINSNDAKWMGKYIVQYWKTTIISHNFSHCINLETLENTWKMCLAVQTRKCGICKFIHLFKSANNWHIKMTLSRHDATFNYWNTLTIVLSHYAIHSSVACALIQGENHQQLTLPQFSWIEIRDASSFILLMNWVNEDSVGLWSGVR